MYIEIASALVLVWAIVGLAWFLNIGNHLQKKGQFDELRTFKWLVFLFLSGPILWVVAFFAGLKMLFTSVVGKDGLFYDWLIR